MNKRILLAAFLSVFLSSSMLGMPFIVSTKSHPADIIVPDDYEKIQWAVGNASDGDTIFVRAGIYVENVVISKSVSLIGENGESTIIDGDGFGTVIEVTANNVTLADFTIRNSGEEEDHGIYLNHVKNTIIQNNNLINNYYGVCLYNSSDNILEDLIVDSNNLTGICLYSSSSNQLVNTTVNSNERYGIQFVDSSNNRITNSRLLDNGWLDFYIIADHDSQCNHALINVNGTENKPIVYYNYSVTIQNWYNNVSEIVLANADNSIINNVTMTRSGTKNNGIRLVRTDHTKINNTRVVDHAYGVLLIHSSNNQLTNITANSNSRYGVYLSGSSNNNVSENNLTNNEEGIWLRFSSNNTISGNNIANNDYGIHLSRSSNFSIISGNNIETNECGIRLSEASHNSIYHNNFANNEFQASTYGLSGNVWDDGHPSGGNYWSDHNPSDEDKDKIGDKSYDIDENNTDRFPLIYPYGYVPSPDINNDETVDIFDVVTVCTAFGCKPGDLDWNPIADINGNTIAEIDGVIDIFDVVLVAKNFGKTV